MKTLTKIATALALFGTVPAHAQQMEASFNGSRDSVMGPEAYFTGTAIVDPYFKPNEHLPSSGAVVTFAPGARSAWHTHPAGQMMIVTSGVGWVQQENGERIEIKPGDVIWTPPGVKHWHGATATNSMAHFVISNMKEGKNVEWLEKVTDEQYGK